MLELTDANGRMLLVAPSSILRVTEAAGGSWHGIGAIVRMVDGAVLEVRETIREIAARLRAAEKREETPS